MKKPNNLPTAIDFRMPELPKHSAIYPNNEIEFKEAFTESKEFKNLLIEISKRGWWARHPKTTFIVGGFFGVVGSALAQKYLLPLIGL